MKFKNGHLITKTNVSDSSQVLQNKDIDGGTASNTSRLTIPKNTKASLDALTRKEGTLVYATDQYALYLDNGSTLIEVDLVYNSKFPGSVKGYFVGGFTSGVVNSSLIDDINFTSETSSQISATLSTAKRLGGSVSGTAKGYFGGGFAGARTNQISALSFDGETTANLSATLNTAKMYTSGASGPTKGYYLGGDTSVATNVIEDQDYLSDTSDVIGATLSGNRFNPAQAACSNLAAFVAGGSNGSGSLSSIDKFTFSTTTASIISATLNVTQQPGVSVCSATKGYIAGGDTNTTIIEDINFLNETSNAISATLSTGVVYTGGVSSTTKGYIGGGASTGTGVGSQIQALTFSSETIATLGATLDTARSASGGVHY